MGHATRPRTRKWLFQPAGQARCTEHVCLDPSRRHYSRGRVRAGATDPGAGQEKAADSEMKQQAQKRARNWAGNYTPRTVRVRVRRDPVCVGWAESEKGDPG